jgi:hypothetical protein
MTKHTIRTILLVLAGSITTQLARGQWEFQQYFDGADTAFGSLAVQFDTTVWQVGVPNKVLMDSAYTVPNALVTRLSGPYPEVPTAYAYVHVPMDQSFFSILAVQWMQLLDMESDVDHGMLHYSIDEGATWENAITSPYTYNLYGHDEANIDTLDNGEVGYTGTDSTWRNIWFCMDGFFLSSMGVDTLRLRFGMWADTVQTDQEGWLIDNLRVAMTIAHTINETPMEHAVEVFPNMTEGPITIEVRKEKEPQVITAVDVLDANGRVVMHHGMAPVRFRMDLSALPVGSYFVRVSTTSASRTVPVMVAR